MIKSTQPSAIFNSRRLPVGGEDQRGYLPIPFWASFGRGGFRGEDRRTKYNFFCFTFLEGDRKNYQPFLFSNAMAKRKGMKIQPAVTELSFTTKTGGDSQDAYYIDTAKELSKMNRRKYDQSRMYAYQGLSFIWRQDAANPLATIEVTLQAAGNTWVTHNSHVKGEAMWNEMQDLVLHDNPSIKGKWHQYIIRLEYTMLTAAILGCRDGTGALASRS